MRAWYCLSHTQTQKQSPLTPVHFSQVFSPESHCFELTAFPHWVRLQGLWSKEKREKKLMVKCLRRQTHEYSLATLWIVSAVVIFIPRQSVCGQNEGGFVVSPVCHQVVVFEKTIEVTKVQQNSTSVVSVRCTDAHRAESDSGCLSAPSVISSPQQAPWIALRGSRSMTQIPPPFKAWPHHIWLHSKKGTGWMNVCVCASVCVYGCFPEGVVSFCWKIAQKRQTPVFSNLRSQFIDHSKSVTGCYSSGNKWNLVNKIILYGTEFSCQFIAYNRNRNKYNYLLTFLVKPGKKQQC